MSEEATKPRLTPEERTAKKAAREARLQNREQRLKEVAVRRAAREERIKARAARQQPAA